MAPTELVINIFSQFKVAPEFLRYIGDYGFKTAAKMDFSMGCHVNSNEGLFGMNSLSTNINIYEQTTVIYTHEFLF